MDGPGLVRRSQKKKVTHRGYVIPWLLQTTWLKDGRHVIPTEQTGLQFATSLFQAGEEIQSLDNRFLVRPFASVMVGAIRTGLLSSSQMPVRRLLLRGVKQGHRPLELEKVSYVEDSSSCKYRKWDNVVEEFSREEDKPSINRCIRPLEPEEKVDEKGQAHDCAEGEKYAGPSAHDQKDGGVGRPRDLAEQEKEDIFQECLCDEGLSATNAVPNEAKRRRRKKRPGQLLVSQS